MIRNFKLVKNLLTGSVNVMNVKKVCVSGFRNLDNVCLDLSDITALISLNSYGKSNVLDAIEYGIDFIRMPKDTRLSIMANQQNIPILKALQDKEYYFCVELSDMFQKKEYIVRYEYSFAWKRDDGTGSKITSERLSIKEKVNIKSKVYDIINRTLNCARYRSSESGRCSTKTSIAFNELVINKLTNFDDLYYLPIINTINSISFYIQRTIDTDCSPIAFINTSIDDFDLSNNENILRAVTLIKEKSPEKFELLINSFKLLFPNIKEVNIAEVEVKFKEFDVPNDVPYKLFANKYKLLIYEKNLNQPMEFIHLSNGTKRIFLLLSLAVIADIHGLPILSFEEPENCIHPRLLQSLLRILVQLCENSKIIISSHSPYLIQYLEPHKIYVGLPQEKGVAFFKRISSKKSKLLFADANENKVSTGDYIFGLISGDESDIETLSSYLEE